MSTASELKPPSRWARLYYRLVIAGPAPYLNVAAIIALTLFMAYQIRYFEMDASNDSVVLENDKDLHFYNHSRLLFGTDDFVVVIMRAKSAEELFSPPHLAIIRSMSDDLRKLKNVELVMSVLDVPLFHSPDVPLPVIAQGKFKTLGLDADPALAPAELAGSPFYSDYLISVRPDEATTAVLIAFDPDRDFLNLGAAKQNLQEKEAAGTLTPEEKKELRKLEKQYKSRHFELSAQRRKDIENIRVVMRDYESRHPELGELHLGGVPMMISDMIDYVEHDIVVFGIMAFLFMLVTLSIVFRSVMGVVIPGAACVVTVLVMVGYLGLVQWQTTLVTANFTSLLLILTMSISIHIFTRYREQYAGHPGHDRRELIFRACRLVWEPCLFMVFTTMVGFGSLILSGIPPVMDFGKMMVMGLAFSLFTCFVFLPALVAVLPKGSIPLAIHADEDDSSNMLPLAVFTGRHPRFVGGMAVVIFIVLFVGITRVSVEARFLDYFSSDSPISEGMTLLDEKMGGTMPLEVVLTGQGKDYWLQPNNIQTVTQIHNYLDELPETGKVLSLETMRRILERINKGKPVTPPLINMARRAIPQQMANFILYPYVTPEFDQTRITMRVHESDKSLRRQELLTKIRNFMDNDMKLKEGEQYHITGYFVLYNNMLQTLFTSLISTFGTVFLTVLVTFWIVFRSLKLALIGLIPNLLAVAVILGVIGWLGIPMDMMTVMIAAVTFGLADDNTIHYIHRFKQEFPRTRDYIGTMYRCHNTIGRPLSYNMVTSVAGFSVLALSSFIPTVYFGLFTGLAMFIALMAAHTLLPMLIITIKPFGPGNVEGPVLSGEPGDNR